MSVKKIAIKGNMYDVITEDEYIRNQALYATNYKFVAIERPGSPYIYPVRKTNREVVPGVLDTGVILYYYDPITPEDCMAYSATNIIDYGDAHSLRDVIMTSQRIASAEASILTTIDNVFVPEIGPNNTPEMIAFKQAIIDKHIDLDKYEQRFGVNYNNDKRLLKKDSITFGKLRDMCNALDIKATIEFRDANPNVPNPIGRVITAEITGESANVEE